MSRLPADRFPYVYVVDTEFIATDGEQQQPVCLVAHGFNKGRNIRIFFDQPRQCPFPDLENTLFIGYNLPAEFQTMLALGWSLPKYAIDLMPEFLNQINGVYRGKDSLKELGYGLVDAVSRHGGNPMDYWKSDKEAERMYIMRNGPVPPDGAPNLDGSDPLDLAVSLEQHKDRILTYCEEDVNATNFLGRAMLPDIDIEQALHRGNYCKAVAHFEHNGVPIDKERFQAIEQNARILKLEIAQKIEEQHNYGVYVIEGKETTKKKPTPVFKMANFTKLLTDHGITIGKRGAMWQATPSGDPMLEDDYFGDMCVTHPWLEPLRQCRKSLNSLGRFATRLGEDGYNRAPLWMFGTVTGRNNPKAAAFMLSRPHWVRNLLAPRQGMALVSVDVTGAEDWLAAGFSGDPELMRIYSSGADSYIEFSVVTGALPEGSKRNKADRAMEEIRAQHKTAKLAIQYGVGANTLSKYLGVPLWKAEGIIQSHKQGYNVYWKWVEDRAEEAEERGYVETDYGWRQSTERMSVNSILNYPQQAGCAELLRFACVLLVGQGYGQYLSAPHHDAIYAHCPAEKAEEVKAAIEEAFREAGHHIMAPLEFPLRVHGSITYAPDHYVDADGQEIWKIVCKFFKWDEFAVSDSQEETSDVMANASEAQHGMSAVS